MSRRIALALVFVACSRSTSPSPGAPTNATPAPASSAPAAVRTGAAVSFAGGGSGYFAHPPDAAKHPAIIVVQEWWGLNDWIKDNTDHFAASGYAALAVDLYRGRSTGSPDEAHELMRGLPEDRAMADMQAAFDWLASRPDVDPARIGVVGWCMGGGYALAFAAAQPKLRAAAVNYGRLITAPEKIAAIHAALLGNFAGQDRGIAPADVRTFTAQLKTTNPDVDVKIYEPDGHAFMNPGNAKGFDEGAAKDAWARIDAFFGRTLGAK